MINKVGLFIFLSLFFCFSIKGDITDSFYVVKIPISKDGDGRDGGVPTIWGTGEFDRRVEMFEVDSERNIYFGKTGEKNKKDVTLIVKYNQYGKLIFKKYIPVPISRIKWYKNTLYCVDIDNRMNRRAVLYKISCNNDSLILLDSVLLVTHNCSKVHFVDTIIIIKWFPRTGKGFMTIPLLYTIEGIFRGVECDSEKIFSVKRKEYFIWVEQGDYSYYPIKIRNSLTDLIRVIEIGEEITGDNPMERYYGDDYYTITERDICILGRSKDDKAIITMVPISALLSEEKR